MELILASILTAFRFGSCNHLIEYKFGLNYGEVFFDYSRNGKEAVNGESYLTSTYNTIATDRGSYFNNSKITLPYNDMVPSWFLLPSQFSLSIWMLSTSTGCIFSRSLNNNNYISIENTNNNIVFRYSFQGTSYNFPSSNSPFYPNNWALISYSTQGNYVSGHFNLNTVFQSNLPSSYIETGNYTSSIGTCIGYNQAFIGFVWYFVIEDSVSYNTYVWSTGNQWLVSGSNGAASCSPGILNLENENNGGCLPTNTNPNQSANGSDCNCGINTGCNITICLVCSSYSCYIGYPPSISCTRSTYKNGFSCSNCYTDCSKCSNPYKCSSCIAVNASPDPIRGCLCNTGYYNTTSLITSSACLVCYSDCASCKDSQICTSCISKNSYPGPIQGCICNDGYYNTTSLATSSACIKCYSECYSCNYTGTCLSCVDSNAHPDAIGCSCNTGYGGLHPLSINGSCVLCYEECYSCTQYNICTACKAEFASPSVTGCSCLSNYQGVHPLNTSDSCYKCNSECASCNNSQTCINCTDPNSVPSLTAGCDCNTGFYKDSSNKCQACNASCTSCSNAFSCIECNGMNTVEDSLSFCRCIQGFYIASKFPTVCNPCNNGCSSCSSASNCSECIQNAFLVGSSCFCKTGYGTLVKNCTQAFFKVSITINQTNSLTLIFEEPTSLYLSNLSLNLNNTNLNFSIEKQDEKYYYITPNYLGDIPKNSNLQIRLEPLVSKNNSLLFNTILHIELFQTSSFSSEGELKARITAAKSLASQGTIIGLSIVIGIGTIDLNFADFFNFISTAEIFYSTTLFNLNLDPVLINFLTGIRMQSKIPSVFSYIIPEQKGSAMPAKYIDYGYSTNLFLLNTRIYLSIIILFLLLSCILFGLNNQLSNKEKLKPIIQLFQYGIFLRLWVQTFLEFLLAGTLGIRYNEFNNPVQLLDCIICFFAIVRYN